jgi:hypothetical protein
LSFEKRNQDANRVVDALLSVGISVGLAAVRQQAYSSMIPRFSPMVTACVRSLAPTLASIFVRWLLTVPSAIESWPAISLFAFPLRPAGAHRARVTSSPHPWRAQPARRRLPGAFAFGRQDQHGRLRPRRSHCRCRASTVRLPSAGAYSRSSCPCRIPAQTLTATTLNKRVPACLC